MKKLALGLICLVFAIAGVVASETNSPTSEGGDPQRMVYLPWDGVKPWTFKNSDPWAGYADSEKPKPAEPYGVTVIRIGRPTNKLDDNVRFYHDGLGMPIIMGFEGHRGFRGAMLGIGQMLGKHPELIHLEFTEEEDGSPGTAPSTDNNLVFYIQDWDKIAKLAWHMVQMGYKPRLKSRNPWWDDWCSITFPDPDGWNVVLTPKHSDLDHSEYNYMLEFDRPNGRCPAEREDILKTAASPVSPK
jgi:catechol 2,3-dioxygenase-like lactoylglutathione lyase family enzyme